MTKQEQILQDRKFIDDIGGAPRLIRLMGWENTAPRQTLLNRINAWKLTGIPLKYKYLYPEIFK